MENILQGVEIADFRITPKDNLEIPRAETLIRVHRFDENWKITVPEDLSKDPLYLNILQKYSQELSIPGSSAASATKDSLTVIKKMYNDPSINLYDENSHYGIYEYKQNIKNGVFFQGNSLAFNDGSAFIIKNNKTELYNWPNSLLENNDYTSKPTAFIGLNENNENNFFYSTLTESLETNFDKNQMKFAFTASPYFIFKGKVLNEKDFFCNSMIGDPRHYIRCPYLSKPFLMKELTIAIRENRGLEIYNAIFENTEITFHLEDNFDEFIKAVKSDPVYGDEFASKIKYDGKNIKLPSLKPAVYNHLFFGITKSKTLVIIQTSGRNGSITGQDGVTISEILNFLNTNNLDLELLFSACEGRDTDNVQVISNGRYIDFTKEESGLFNLNGAFIRGKITSSHILISND